MLERKHRPSNRNFIDKRFVLRRKMTCEMAALVLSMSWLLRGASGLQCYKCTSATDKSCASNPRNITSCSTLHWSGCGTLFHRDGTVTRGCSKMRLHPAGCEIVNGSAERCVCHNDLCNSERTPPAIGSHPSTFRCFVCNSTAAPHSCRSHVVDRGSTSVPSVLCPSFSGCFLTSWKGTDGNVHWERDCPWTTAGFPASFAPSTCYHIMGKEVCVCRTDLCNASKDHASKSGEEEAKSLHKSSASSAVTFRQQQFRATFVFTSVIQLLWRVLYITP